ncbi:MAG TPA: hypothetical protein VM070_00350, partial [Candidatus Saccharimonadales bacterium]|nr:hypothetical protein [Candidatus Saccharimonadales bacterium]
MTGSKADRPYGTFARRGGAPGPEIPPPGLPASGRGPWRWLRRRTRRERALLLGIALLLVV